MSSARVRSAAGVTPTTTRKRRVKLDSESKPTSEATSITASVPESSSRFAASIRTAVRNWPGVIPVLARKARLKWNGLYPTSSARSVAVSPEVAAARIRWTAAASTRGSSGVCGRGVMALSLGAAGPGTEDPTCSLTPAP